MSGIQGKDEDGAGMEPMETQHGARGRMGDKPSKKNPRLWETFCFSLFASVNLNILFSRER